MTDWPDVVFRLPENELPRFMDELTACPELDHSLIRSAGAAGGGDIVAIVVQLTPPVLSFVSGLVAAWAARPRATVEIGTIKVTGLSKRTAEEALRAALAKAQPGAADEKR